jgi:hypothetical protein
MIMSWNPTRRRMLFMKMKMCLHALFANKESVLINMQGVWLLTSPRCAASKSTTLLKPSMFKEAASGRMSMKQQENMDSLQLVELSIILGLVG